MKRLSIAAILCAALVSTVAGQAAAGPETGFEDVPDDNIFATSISWLRLSGITRGCNPPINTAFCPQQPITREQMAAFLTRALELDPASTTNRFEDDDDSPFEAAIDRLAGARITAGCNPPANDKFCPEATVTRGQMAAFLTRAYRLPPASGGQFTDTAVSAFREDIDRLAAAGITAGCNPPANDKFCPNDLVTREQFATFVWRAAGRSSVPEPTRIVAAGDIAECSWDKDEETALLVDRMFASTNGVVAALGDTAYSDGSPQQFRDCYQPSWGRHKFRTRPAVGNHEYRTSGATGYFDYFGSVAGDPDEGWYSYEIAGWNVVVLNSNCDEIDGCDVGSDQEEWLRSTLAASSAQCTLAYMHAPRFSSGVHGDADWLEDLWQALDDHGADLMLAGHDHNYERISPLHADGTAATSGGIQSFVVGTGGTWLRETDSPRPGSDVLIDDKHGVLVLDLEPDSYEWQFVDTSGAVLDEGSRACS